jgi:hypothetical protein
MKVEARALALRGEALAAMDRRVEAEAALSEAVRIAEAIGYPRAAWAALGLMAEVKRRSGALADAEHHAASRRALVAQAAQSLGAGELRRALEASAGWRD